MGGVTGPEKHPVATYNKLFRIPAALTLIGIPHQAGSCGGAIGTPELPAEKVIIGRQEKPSPQNHRLEEGRIGPKASGADIPEKDRQIQ
jgi:hypothetical protein